MKKLLAVAGVLLLCNCSSKTADEANVKEAARAAIIHNLKSPSSVKFHHNEYVKQIDDSTFIYTETIEATNTYGGLIAQNAYTTVKWKGGDASDVDNWNVLDLQFKER